MKNLLLLMMIINLTSCASVKLSDLQPTAKNEKLLPALEPKIDMQSFEGVYTSGYSTITNTDDKNASINISTFNNDPGIQDAITIFDRDVKNNICNQNGKCKGYIVCRIPAGIIKEPSNGMIFFSTLTFFVPNFIGFPLTNYNTALDVEVEIYNNSDSMIARYTAQGQYRAWVAFYYGYNSVSAPRISNIKAFKYAMNNIKKQIEKDSEKLIAALSK